MAKTSTGSMRAEVEYAAKRRELGRQRLPAWHGLALVGIIVISLCMNFYQLGQNGFGTFFYAAGVRSMLDSWHNFFFVSYDPGGFVSIDKPPLGFWLEVASARLFGFTPFSVFLPQALAGVLAVIVLYYLVRRHFGGTAGLLAALALALSPISVVTARYHTIDSTLALALLLGAWAVMRAAESGRLRWLLLSAAIVGIGFNIKMLEAYLVIPAFGLLYLLAAPRSVWIRVGQLALAGVLLLAVSLSWALAVDMTPASQRPYVGSSQNNSEISLAFGYNGIERLIGRFGGQFGRGRGGSQGNARGGSTAAAGTTTPQPGGNAPQAQRRPVNIGGFGSGAAGPLRLFSEPLGGQIAWLLPLAMLGALALAWQRRPRPREDTQQQSLLLWAIWLLTMGIFFSVASFFQPYYMTEMAPAVCALSGIGLVVMWHDYRRCGWRGWLLPLALVATALVQVRILAAYPAWGRWLIPLIVVLCVVSVLALVAARLGRRWDVKVVEARLLALALAAGVLALLIAPAVWAAIPVIQNTTAQSAMAGPQQENGLAGNFGGGNGSVDPALLRYLEAKQGVTKFLVATPSSMTADGIILATNRPVMALGGFSGSDPILTTGQLATLVANGTVRFFLLSSGQRLPSQVLERIPEQYRSFPFGGRTGGFGAGQQGALTSWVSQHCTTVAARLWRSAAGSGRVGVNQLYDCASRH